MSSLPSESELLEMKQSIDAALQKDTEHLAFLRATRASSVTATGKITDMLDTFDTRLGLLESAIRPLHRETTTLMRARDNMKLVLDYLEDVEEFYDTSGPLAKVIRGGPAYQLPAYLEAMKRIHRAIHYFQNNNQDSSELESLQSLFDEGLHSLEEEFHRVLQRHSVIPDVEAILSNERDDSHVLSEEVVTELRDIASWLHDAQTTDEFISSYAGVRSNLILSALNALPDGSPGSFAVPGTPSRPTKTKSALGTPSSGVINRRMSGVKNVTKSALSRTGSMLRKVRKDSSQSELRVITEPDNRLGSYKRGQHRYLFYARAVVRYMQRETVLAKQIIPPDLLPRLLCELFAPINEGLATQGEILAEACSQSLSLKKFFSVVYVYDVIGVLHALYPDYQALVDFSKAQDVIPRFETVLGSLAAVASRALRSFQDMVNGESSRKRPEDGTVHELTSNTLGFLSELGKYVEAAGSVLQQDGPAAVKRYPSPSDSDVAVAGWVLTVLKALTSNLRRKARGYELAEEPLGCVFLLNNYDYISRTMQASAYSGLLRDSEVDFDGFFARLMEDQRVQYQQTTWSTLQGYLIVEDVSPDGLTKKEREVIKERYSGFNEEFGRILAAQSEYTVPNQELRNRLREDNAALVVPLFRAFDQTYRQSGFSSKNPHKYLRYTPGEIEEAFLEFFGAER